MSERTDPALPVYYNAAKIDSPRFFIFGPERSGTTLLAFLLSGQPSLFVLNDSFVFDRFIEWSLMGDRGSKRDKPSRVLVLGQKLARDLTRAVATKPLHIRDLYYAARERYAIRLSGDRIISSDEIDLFHKVLRARYLAKSITATPSFLNAYADGLQPATGAMSLAGLFSQTILGIAELFTSGPSQLVVGEKTPLHIMYANWIRTLYPQAKYVLVVRDPVANVASIYRRWGDLRRSENIYAMYARRVIALAERPDVLTVRYEDVRTSPSDTVRAILAFLALDHLFDPATRINAYVKAAYTGEAIDPSRNTASRDLLSQIDARRLGRRFEQVRQRFYQ